MRRQHTSPNAYPAQLLDECLRLLRRGSYGPAAAALHTRSPDARALLAYAAGSARTMHRTVLTTLAVIELSSGGHGPASRKVW